MQCCSSLNADITCPAMIHLDTEVHKCGHEMNRSNKCRRPQAPHSDESLLVERKQTGREHAQEASPLDSAHHKPKGCLRPRENEGAPRSPTAPGMSDMSGDHGLPG